MFGTVLVVGAEGVGDCWGSWWVINFRINGYKLKRRDREESDTQLLFLVQEA